MYLSDRYIESENSYLSSSLALASTSTIEYLLRVDKDELGFVNSCEARAVWVPSNVADR